VRTAALLAALLALAVPAAAGTPRPVVFAASSLTEVFPRIDRGARYSFAGSDDLALQIRQGAPADVFASASQKYADDLYARGLVDRPRVFALNRLAVIVPAANPARITSVYDLRRHGVRLVLAAPSVPIGKYAREVLSRLGLESALANVASEERDAKGVVAKVALGEADAGLVYRTDVRPVAGKVRLIAIPGRGQPSVRYEIAVVKRGSNLSAARAFVARVLGPVGRTRLSAGGFLLP
jgi:molybdate transport system substrate-binding protein